MKKMLKNKLKKIVLQKKRSTISLCLIVKNEEDILEQALESIHLVADEIIIVDTGSTDKTIEIAKKYTDKIYHFEWISDMSAARNYCQSFATMDYICRWDADWVLRAGDVKKITKLKEVQFGNSDVISFRWNVEFSDIINTKSGHKEAISYQPNFFIFRNNEFLWESPIHNRLIQRKDIPKKKILYASYLSIQVDHLKDPLLKGHRYTQTLAILRSEIAKKNHLYNYLMPFYVDALVYNEDYHEAVEQIEKLDFKHFNDKQIYSLTERSVQSLLHLNRFEDALAVVEKTMVDYLCDLPEYILLHGDVLALFDPARALEKYTSFLKIRSKFGLPRTTDNTERNQIHPRLMMSQIHIENKRFHQAKELLEYVVSKTLIEKTRTRALELITIC